MTKEIKYLGVTINDQKICFITQKKQIIQKARKMANMTYTVIAQSVNKILIGKTYWKRVVLPSILHETNVIQFTKSELEQLQKLENSVYRYIQGASRYAQVPTLRREIGASSMHA